MIKRKNAPIVGELSTNKELLGRRDAFHVPGVLVKCSTPVAPGEWVMFVNPQQTQVQVVAPHSKNRQALVDPFIPAISIPAGTLFWVFPKPGMVQNLVHSFELSPVVDREEFIEAEEVKSDADIEAGRVETVESAEELLAKVEAEKRRQANADCEERNSCWDCYGEGEYEDCLDYEANDSCAGCYE